MRIDAMDLVGHRIMMVRICIFPAAMQVRDAVGFLGDVWARCVLAKTLSSIIDNPSTLLLRTSSRSAAVILFL